MLVYRGRLVCTRGGYGTGYLHVEHGACRSNEMDRGQIRQKCRWAKVLHGRGLNILVVLSAIGHRKIKEEEEKDVTSPHEIYIGISVSVSNQLSRAFLICHQERHTPSAIEPVSF